MGKSIYFDPVALDNAYYFTRAGARRQVVAAIMSTFDPTEVTKACSAYASQWRIKSSLGPEGEERVTLYTVLKRRHLAAAMCVYESALKLGLPEVEALRRAYERYEELAQHVRSQPKQYVNFERFYALTRSYSESTLKITSCKECQSRYLLSDDPVVPRECPFCTMFTSRAVLNTTSAFRLRAA